MTINDPSAIETILRDCHTIAVVGLSSDPNRPSYDIAAYMQRHGYRVIPVNPGLAGQQIHGQTVAATLADIAEPIDMVDIFRNSEAAGETVDEAIAAGVRAVWMQLGVVNAAAAARAEAAGLRVVMDHCPAIEIPRLGIPPVR